MCTTPRHVCSHSWQPMASIALVPFGATGFSVLQDQLNRTKEDYMKFSDQHLGNVPPLAVSDRIWLSTQHLPSQLDNRFLSPFLVEAIVNPVAYRSTLPYRASSPSSIPSLPVGYLWRQPVPTRCQNHHLHQ
ncbi:hypothetical protein L345_03595, partial [Ophiophagus hannah]